MDGPTIATALLERIEATLRVGSVGQLATVELETLAHIKLLQVARAVRLGDQ